MPDAPRIPCGEHVSYYSSWATDTWQCPCGWTGTGQDAAWEPFDALVQVDCPECDKRLCLVTYPSGPEVTSAAADGNEEAKRALAAEKRREQREEKFKKSKLVRASQLPILKGVDEIDLLLDCEETDSDTFYVLYHEGQRLHAEEAWWESNAPLRRYCRYAVRRYGDRIKTFTIGSGASMWLAGDSLRLFGEQAEILKEFGLVEKASDA